MKTAPVLLLTWRRVDEISHLISVLREVRPPVVFISSDGPRLDQQNDILEISAVRNKFETDVDWPCRIERLYHDQNLGCARAVTIALKWFFSNVDEGIILEEDCIPHESFFRFCSENLIRYRYDTRVWCITGSNFNPDTFTSDSSYFFSQYPHCWGWASWSRCISEFPPDPRIWPELVRKNQASQLFDNNKEGNYWERIWTKLYETGKPDSWAYLWFLTCKLNNALTITPSMNLVRNIGYGPNATHTIHGKSPSGQVSGIKSINHPLYVIRDRDRDRYTYRHYFNGRRREFPFCLVPHKQMLAKVLSCLRLEKLCYNWSK